MSNFIRFCALLFSLSVSLIAQSVPYEKYQLPNGMTVILHEDHSVPTTVINTWYYVGSKDEPERRSGFAHLFEHLMFMGTRRVPGGDFDNIMEKFGGWNNASTSQDRTNYYSFGPSELLPTLLWLDADRLQDLGSMMTQEKLDKQRDIVRNERRQSYENRPYGKAQLRINEIMYPPGHPYHDPVIGSHEDLEAATVEDVKDFFSTYYLPSNASLVIAGDFDPSEIKPLVADLFGTLPRGSEPIHAAPQPVGLGRVVRNTMTDKVQLPRTWIVYHSPALFEAGDADLDLASAILSSGISSRLYQALIYQGQLAVNVYASQQSAFLGSTFVISATAKPGVDLSVIEDRIDAVVQQFIAEGPTDEEVSRNKASLEFQTVSALESLMRKADLLNRYQFHRGEPDSFQWDLERYRATDQESIRRAVEQWLTPDSRLILRVLPENRLPDADPRDAQPALLAQETFQLPVPDTFKLSNGIPVHFWKRDALPLVEVQVLFEGGANSDGDLAGRANLTAEMLDEGTEALSAIEFSNQLDMLGVRFSTNAGREGVQLSLSSLKSKFAEALPLLADAVQRPRFDETEWARVKDLQIQNLRRQQDNPNAVAQLAGARAYFGDSHPYGRPVQGTTESVQKLTTADLKDFHRQLYQPANATILIAGDLTADEAKSQLEQAFGLWQTDAASLPKVTPPDVSPAPLKLVIVDRPDAVQTVVNFYMPAPPFAASDHVRREMIGTILGGSFTSRLNQNLREEHGYTYGARSSYQLGESVSYLIASSSVQAQVTGAALKEFLNEFRGIQGGDITEDEITKARANYRSGLLQSYSSLRAVLGTAAGLIEMGRPFTASSDDLSLSAGVTAAELNQLAPAAVPLENALILLVGDKKQILGQLEGLDLPAPVELTVDGAPVQQ